MHVHQEVLEVARRLASKREDWSFNLQEVLAELPGLNQNTVRTHVVSRCCVNAPKNHLHKWDYFRRIGRARYQIETKHRRSQEAPLSPASHGAKGAFRQPDARLRKNIHAVVQNEEGIYVVECLELPVVTQGRGLDEAVANFQEALALHLEGENLSTLGLIANPVVQILYEIPAA